MDEPAIELATNTAAGHNDPGPAMKGVTFVISRTILAVSGLSLASDTVTVSEAVHTSEVLLHGPSDTCSN